MGPISGLLPSPPSPSLPMQVHSVVSTCVQSLSFSATRTRADRWKFLQAVVKAFHFPAFMHSLHNIRISLSGFSRVCNHQNSCNYFGRDCESVHQPFYLAYICWCQSVVTQARFPFHYVSFWAWTALGYQMVFVTYLISITIMSCFTANSKWLHRAQVSFWEPGAAWLLSGRKMFEILWIHCERCINKQIRHNFWKITVPFCTEESTSILWLIMSMNVSLDWGLGCATASLW